MKQLPAAWLAAPLLVSAWAASAIFLDSPEGWLGVLSGLLYLAAIAALLGPWRRRGWRDLAAWILLNALVLIVSASFRPISDG